MGGKSVQRTRRVEPNMQTACCGWPEGRTFDALLRATPYSLKTPPSITSRVGVWVVDVWVVDIETTASPRRMEHGRTPRYAVDATPSRAASGITGTKAVSMYQRRHDETHRDHREDVLLPVRPSAHNCWLADYFLHPLREGFMKWMLFCAAIGDGCTGNWIVWSPFGIFRYFDSFQEAREFCVLRSRRSTK